MKFLEDDVEGGGDEEGLTAFNLEAVGEFHLTDDACHLRIFGA